MEESCKHETMNFSVGKWGQGSFMSKTYPYKHEVGYAAIRSIKSVNTHNIISMQTYGYNYEYTQHRVASINLHRIDKTIASV